LTGLWRDVFRRFLHAVSPRPKARRFKLVSLRGYRLQRVIVPNFQEQSPMALDHEIMTVKEVCGILRVNRSTLYKLVKQGKIPAFRIGTDWRFRKEGIERCMIEQTRGGGPR
jgi:excisionase family DNA binding protein